jgi:hypothetical protein
MQGNGVIIGTQPAGFDQEVVELLQIPRVRLEGMGRRPFFETEIAQKTSVIHDYRKNRGIRRRPSAEAADGKPPAIAAAAC